MRSPHYACPFPDVSPSPWFSWVLLAAGASTRLGQAKQTLTLNDKPLIVRQVEILLHTGLPVTVIQGAVDLNSWLNPINTPNLQLIDNPNWQQGMHTSIQLALHRLPQYNLGWVLVDQYAITTQQCHRFYHHWYQHRQPILVSRYHTSPDAWGVPVITSADLNPTINKTIQAIEPSSKDNTHITRVNGSGLKPWLKAHRQKFTWDEWYWPEAQHDIDTQAQWLQVQNQQKKGSIDW